MNISKRCTQMIPKIFSFLGRNEIKLKTHWLVSKSFFSPTLIGSAPSLRIFENEPFTG
jgi:hypothetical protein